MENADSLDKLQYYYNSQWNFSLTLPSGWEEIPEATLKAHEAVIQEATKSSYNYLAAFQKRSDQYFSYHYFLIQLIDTQGLPPAILEEYFSSAKGEQAVTKTASEVRQVMKDFASLSSMNITGIDKERHVIFVNISGDVVGAGKIKGVSAMFMGKTSLVCLHLFALQQDFESHKKQYFDQIINSFEYDFGYGFPNNISSNNKPEGSTHGDNADLSRGKQRYDFEEFIASQHGFAARFPGKPEKNVYGPVTNYAAVIDGEAAYNVHVSPRSPVFANRDIKVWKDTFLRGKMLPFGKNARIIKSQVVRFLDHDALEYEYIAEMPEARSYSKGVVFDHQSRNYDISMICIEQAKNVAYDKYRFFLDSFRWISAFEESKQ